MTVPDDQEETVARLVRLAGVRMDVPPERETRVRQAVLAEVRAVSAARVRRRRLVMWSASAAAACAASVVATIFLRGLAETGAPPREELATIERLQGRGGRISGPDGAAGAVRGASVRAGEEIVTESGGGVALRAGEVSLRLDSASRVRLVSSSALELEAGAVYVDNQSGSSALEIRTPFGLVRDVGTQFEARLLDDALRVRVRSGLVEVVHAGSVASAKPGFEVTVGQRGVSQRPVASYGKEWSWTAALAPDFETEGRSLATVLEHLCREQGWTISFAEPRLALDVSGIIVHGSVGSLPASDALSVVLPTSGLDYSLEDGLLRVFRASR